MWQWLLLKNRIRCEGEQSFLYRIRIATEAERDSSIEDVKTYILLRIVYSTQKYTSMFIGIRTTIYSENKVMYIFPE